MYKGLDIVTNKVTMDEQRMVRHHMINILDPLSTNTVVDFRNKALPVMEKLLMEGKIPFICGGTNYYIESLLWKILLDQETVLLSSGETGKRVINDKEVPEKRSSSDKVEMKVDFNEIDDNSIETQELFKLLRSVDPKRAEQLHPKERRKIWR